MSLCPYCFSELGTWVSDPILTTPSAISGYEGFTIIKPHLHITEIQEHITELEEETELTPTIFTPCTWKLLGVHIREIRTAIERLLGFYESDKDTYFNYDAEGNDMRSGDHQLDWAEEIVDDQTIIRASHIEELRHPIPVPTTVAVIIHCHNPEGKEINSIEYGQVGGQPLLGDTSSKVAIYDNDVLIGYGAKNSIQHNQIYNIIIGHTIKAVFNGITKQQIVTGVGSIVLTFSRDAEFDLETYAETYAVKNQFIYKDNPFSLGEEFNNWHIQCTQNTQVSYMSIYLTIPPPNPPWYDTIVHTFDYSFTIYPVATIYNDLQIILLLRLTNNVQSTIKMSSVPYDLKGTAI